VPVELKAVDLGITEGIHYFGALLSDLRQRKELERANEHLLLELAHLAATDHLTGLLNRRAFEDEAQRALALAERDPSEIGLGMLDLDKFKLVNDCFGHAAGDHVLREVVATIRSELRRGDLFGRIGGEEFTLLLPDTAPGEAAALAERLRLAVAAMEIPVNAPAPLRITISIGLAHWGVGQSLPRLMEIADRALFQAKTNGRNQSLTVDPGFSIIWSRE
jgi:diguanylate cyclase (GGDEF)-like protein